MPNTMKGESTRSSPNTAFWIFFLASPTRSELSPAVIQVTPPQIISISASAAAMPMQILYRLLKKPMKFGMPLLVISPRPGNAVRQTKLLPRGALLQGVVAVDAGVTESVGVGVTTVPGATESVGGGVTV